MSKYKLLVLFTVFFTACNVFSSNEENQSEQTLIETTTTTTSTTTTSTTIEQTTNTTVLCTPDNNQENNFSTTLKIQIFLNKYGFNAGDEDGYLGNQTIVAIKNFQSSVGLTADGDAGPNTIQAMKLWTGCEEIDKSIFIDESQNTTTTIPETTTTTTATTTTTSTTTTIPTVTISNESEYGILPSVSLTNNQVTSIFKGFTNTSSICGVPYINNLDTGVKNYYENGLVDFVNIGDGKYTSSDATAKITQVSSSQFTVLIEGNGDAAFKYFFIEPFSSQLINLTPSSITTATGKTTAVFEKNNLKNGYWFFSFAENNSGKIIKSSGLREVLVGDNITQTLDSDISLDSVFFTRNNQNIVKGQNVNSANNLAISYTTNKIYDNRSNTPSLISATSQTITLSNENQAKVNEIIHIGRELMLVTGKTGSSYKVTRGYLNTQQAEHASGSSVRVIEKYSSKDLKSNFAYAVIRSESGLKYQISLGSELSPATFNTNGCPNGLYSFEEISIFTWRAQGSSIVYSSRELNLNNPVFNKQFLINDSYTYSSPTLESSDENGEFLNSGPRNKIVKQGDKISFDFSGINKGSSNIKFIEMKFQMNPLSGSSKKSTERSLFFDILNSSYKFEISVNKILNSSSFKSSEWESGYRYILKSFSLYDEDSKTTFLNNQEVVYDFKNTKGSHNTYYLDQFIFEVP